MVVVWEATCLILQYIICSINSIKVYNKSNLVLFLNVVFIFKEYLILLNIT